MRPNFIVRDTLQQVVAIAMPYSLLQSKMNDIPIEEITLTMAAIILNRDTVNFALPWAVR